MMVHHLQTPFNKERRIILKKIKRSQKGYREQRGHWRNWEFQVQWFFLLLLSRFSCVWLSVTPWTAAHQAPVPEILQARVLVWVAIAFSNAWKWKMKVKPLSHVPLLAIPWTEVHQAPPSMGFSRKEYWGRVPLPSQDFSWVELKQSLIGCTLARHEEGIFLFHVGPSSSPGMWELPLLVSQIYFNWSLHLFIFHSDSAIFNSYAAFYRGSKRAFIRPEVYLVLVREKKSECDIPPTLSIVQRGYSHRKTRLLGKKKGRDEVQKTKSYSLWEMEYCLLCL